MKSRKWILSSKLVLRIAATLLACVVFVLAAQSVIAALTCVPDGGGANDQPGQKDLTRWCVDYHYSATQHQVIWDWDDIAWTGNNTGDGCSLYDNDSDGQVNYALCVTVGGNPAVEQSTRLYSCGDAKSDRCTTPTEILSFASYCDASQQGTDPFAAGGAYPQDTVADCKILESEIGTGTWVDVCSYPSQVPNSAPADCVSTIPVTAYLTLEKTVVGAASESAFTPQIDSNNVSWDTAYPVNAGTHTVSEIGLAGYLPSGWGGDCSAGGSVTLAAGENKTCSITNTYQEVPSPDIAIKKYTNGYDADDPAGPQLVVGEAVVWTYEVMNTGSVTVDNVAVTDDIIGVVTCPKTALTPGESMTCTAYGTATEGQYGNVGTVTAKYEGRNVGEDTDPSHYFATTPPLPPPPPPPPPEFVPELGSIALLASGMAGLAGYATLRRRARH